MRTDLNVINAQRVLAKLQEKNITFIHGSSSATLMTTGKLGRYALRPTGILRKKYSCYPISGELGMGSRVVNRKSGINYKNISGMLPNYEGVKCTLYYALGVSQFDLKKLKESIDSQIDDISKKNSFF